MKTFILLSWLTLVATAAAAVTETYTATHPLTADGSITLDNTNGPIEITGWDKNEVSIEAIKEAPDSDSIARIHVFVESASDHILIRTDFDKSWKFWGSVQASVRYKLRVPAKARLEKINSVNANITIAGVHGAMNIDTTNGFIKATGLRADVRFDTTNGPLTAEFTSLKNVKQVKLETINGRIEVTLPKKADARLTTRTINGSTKVAQALKLEESGKLGLTGQLGTGGPEIMLKTVNGSISVTEN